MEVKRAREERDDLESQIADLLLAFTQKTGLIVDAVQVDAFSTDYRALQESPEETVDTYLVSILARL